jgi:hypothetical protein
VYTPAEALHRTELRPRGRGRPRGAEQRRQVHRLDRPTPKKDLYLLAARMTPAEIHPEVREKLDRLAEALVGADGGA